MALLKPTGKLIVGAPNHDGHITRYGLGRDWRPRPDWIMRGCEYIEPLGAIAPSGLLVPQEMTLTPGGLFTASVNDAFREINVSGNPVVTWLEFYDGSVYTDPDVARGLLTSYYDTWTPNWVLSLVRWCPPIGQGVYSYVIVEMEASVFYAGSWVDGFASLVLPLQDAAGDHDSPFLHTIRTAEFVSSYNVLTEGRILAQGSRSSSSRQGPAREQWAFEWIEDTNRFTGGHFLIRQLGEHDGKFWHYYARDMRVLTGTVRINVCGNVTALNLSPIRYGESTMTARARYPKGIPIVYDSGLGENAWVDDPEAFAWDGIATLPADWTVTVEDYGISNPHWPQVTFDRGAYGSAYLRPVVWLVTEQSDSIIANADTDTETTEGEHILHALSWSWNRRYRGSEGVAEVHPTPGATPVETWRTNARVEVHLGWQAGAGAGLESTQIAIGYIIPGGIPRGLDGSNENAAPSAPGVRVGAFDVARWPQKDIIDLRQAGGMTVSDWLSMVGNRMGLPASMIDCDVAVADLAIPVTELPSHPAHAPQDGDKWDQHIDAVEAALNIRVGFGKNNDGHLFADAGPPAYDPYTSTIAFTVDYNTTTSEDRIWRIVHNDSGEEFRNLLKITIDPDAAEPSIFYWAEQEATRRAGIGDTWEFAASVEVAQGDVLGDVGRKFDQDHYQWQDTLEWEGPLRPENLLPDAFVEIGECPYVGLTVGDIYQVTDHAVAGQGQGMGLGGTSTLRLVRVYPTDEGPYSDA